MHSRGLFRLYLIPFVHMFFIAWKREMNVNDILSSKHMIAIIPYGSHVYGTADYNSDHDYIVIVRDGVEHDDQYRTHIGDYSVYSETHFQKLLDEQYIGAIEAFFTNPIQGSLKQFTYKVNLSKLRESISQRASNSFVKCKKKLTVETNEERIGVKSLFHSLRMISFGIQIATKGKIEDFTCANHYWKDIQTIGYDWNSLKEKYQPVYNQLSSNFRLVAPK